MSMRVQNDDFAEVTRVVARQGDEGMKISEVVNALARVQNMPASRARYVVRSALDKGKVRTDRNFRLHLTVPE